MHVLAIDLGASSGKMFLGNLDENNLKVTEIHRFSNNSVHLGNRLHWDILRLFHEIKLGLLKAKHLGYEEIQSIGIDTWGLDFGLIDLSGELLGNPYHYRDEYNERMLEKVNAIIESEVIYSRTGTQFLSVNSLYQLFAIKEQRNHLFDVAETFLMIPDLIRYFLTGQKKGEVTTASTTQLFNPYTMNWESYLMEELEIPRKLFPEVVKPGTSVGEIKESICKELGIKSFPVIAVGEHDTASAVASVPTLEENFAYLSCGTWSLLGTELPAPLINDAALKLNFTNEIGVEDTFRFLKNIMGLWIIQECQRTWEKEGKSFSFDELNNLVDQENPFCSFIDPDHPMFLNPGNMPLQIQKFCQLTNQTVPVTKGKVLRCVLESLAMKYRYVLEQIEMLTNKTFTGLHIVGGGTKNRLLCQFTANAISRPIWAGPGEASAIGNILMQYISTGEIESITKGREIVKNSFFINTYYPEGSITWDEGYKRFCEIIVHQEIPI